MFFSRLFLFRSLILVSTKRGGGGGGGEKTKALLRCESSQAPAAAAFPVSPAACRSAAIPCPWNPRVGPLLARLRPHVSIGPAAMQMNACPHTHAHKHTLARAHTQTHTVSREPRKRFCFSFPAERRKKRDQKPNVGDGRLLCVGVRRC